jgi:hypothetical protein
MRLSKSIIVHPLEIPDFRFIRRLASKQDNFTIPPIYVLWLLKQTNSRSCMVAEHVKLGPVAYLLSLPVNNRRGTVLYIWQLAASKRGLQAGAIDELLLALRALMRRMRIQRVLFTSVPGSLEFRVIRRHAYSLFGVGLRSKQILPASVSRKEREFFVKLI